MLELIQILQTSMVARGSMQPFMETAAKRLFRTIINHGADVNAANKNNVTALVRACYKGNTDAINELLNAGADPNTSLTSGETWVHAAIEGDCSRETLQVIINHGADVNATNKNNVTSLMRACYKGNMDVINELLNAGADPNIADSLCGKTWIHWAVKGGCSKETLQAIINLGADVNATNEYKSTALMMACEIGNIDAINVLLNAKADSNIANTNSNIWIHNANPHHIDDLCSSQVILQTIRQWLHPIRHHVHFPELDMTESLCFNVASRIIYRKLRHTIWNKIYAIICGPD